MHAIAGGGLAAAARALQRDQCYVIGDVLVDTGVKQSAGRSAGLLEGRSISAIALTHAHGDHAGASR